MTLLNVVLLINLVRFCNFFIIFRGFENDGEKKGISTVMFRSMDVKAFTYVEHNVHGVNN